MAYPSDLQFVPISITVNGVTQTVFDVLGDESPSSTDIVGNATFPAAYFAYDGANVYFRLRLNTDPRTNQLSGFRNFSWGVLIRTTSPPGFYDYMFNVNGLNSTVNIWQNTQRIFNSWNDPAEMLEFSQPISNYNFARVLPANSSFGANPDFFLDWFLPATTFFNAIGISPTTQISTTFFSSANANNYNKDSLRTSEGFSFIASQSDPISPDDVDVRARLSVSKSLTSGPNPVLVGQQATWTETITVTNTGRSNATSVILSDLIGVNTTASFTIGSTSQGTAVYTPSTRRVSWTVGSLAPGSSVVLTYSVTGIFSGTGSQTLNTATVNGFDSFTGGGITASATTTITVNPTSGIYGRIVNGANGLPVQSATITITGPQQTTSNGGGNYSFSNLVSGTYNVTITAPNFQPFNTSITLGVGQVQELNVLLQPANGTVSGTVSGEGDPLTGATVSLTDVFGFTRFFTTLAGGAYSFNVPPGNYTLSVNADGFQFESRGIMIASNQTLTENFDLQTSNGAITGNIAPLGATITVLTSEGVFVTSLETTLGSYTINGLPPGSYIVRASASGYITEQQGAIVEEGETTTVNFSLTMPDTPSSLSGTVTDNSTPLFATVTVLNSLGQVYTTVSTDENTGIYEVDDLPIGFYTVVFSANGYASRTIGVNVVAGPNPLSIELTRLAGAISGTVLANDSSPLSATVSLLQNGIQIATTQTTSQNGMFSFGNLAPGSYTVSATAQGYQTQVSAAIVEAFEVTTINFVLQEAEFSLSGRVTESANPTVGINGAIVVVRQGSANGPIIATTTTGTNILDDGTYQVSDLLPDVYVVTVNAISFESASSSVVIVNADVSLDFSLTNEAGTISGIITSSAGPPIIGANVEIRILDASGAVVANVVTDGSGFYQTPDLAYGTYTIIASAPDFQTNGATVVLSSPSFPGVNISLEPNPGFIQGTIVSTDGPAITGATVQILDQNGILIQTVFTDSNGFYRTEGLAAGSYTVTAFVQGFQANSTGVTVLSNTTSIGNLALSPFFATVQGTVVNSVGSVPLRGALIQIFTSTNQFIASVVTNADGAYTYNNLGIGSYIITATANGFVTQAAGLIVQTVPSFSTVNFSLEETTVVFKGKVVDSQTQDGIGNATVVITDNNETVLGTAFTNAQGEFQIAGLPESFITVTITAPNYSIFNQGVLLPIIPPDEFIAELTTTIGNISGTVSNADNPSQPIPNANIVVRASTNGVVVATVTADANGSFFIPGLSAGSYTITASVSGNGQTFGTETIGVTVIAGETVLASILLLPTSFPISGEVLDAGNNNPLINVPNVQVSLYNAQNVLIRTILADFGTGGYRFENLQPGTYFIAANAPDYYPNIISAFILNAPVTADIPLSQVQVIDSGTIFINVHTPTTTPVAGAAISLKTSNNLVIATGVTDSNGNFEFTDIPLGSYIVTADKEGFGTDSRAAFLTTDSPTANIDFVLSPDTGNLTGFIIDVLTGLPIAGVTISVEDRTGAVVAETVTGTNGFYSFNGLAPGTYTVVADAFNYGPQTAGAIITSSQTLNLGFALLPDPGYVLGAVLSGTDPVPGAAITVREGSIGGPIVWDGRTTSDGTFLTTGLNTGTYIITVSADDFVTSQTGAIVQSGTNEIVIYLAEETTYFISGEITNTNNEPLPNTFIRVLDQLGNIVGRTQTDSDGRYLVNGLRGFLEPVQYTVVADNDLYQTGIITRTISGANIVNGDITLLDNPVTLSGTVFDNNTNIPLVGAVLEIYNATTNVLARRVLSTVNGVYLAEGLAPGNYRVNTSYPNYGVGLNQIVLPPLVPSSLNVPLLANPGIVTGIVAGLPIGTEANVTVYVLNTNLEVVGVVTQTDPQDVRSFSIPDLVPGSYTLVVSSPGYVSGIREFSITPGATTNVGTITLSAASSPLTVTVTSDGVTGIENASVLIYLGDAFVISQNTNQNGQATFNLGAGTYRVVVISEGFVSQEQEVTLPDEDPLPFILVGEPTTLTGIVRNVFNNQLIDGAIVTISGPTPAQFDTTSNGQFFFSSLTGGTYTIGISAAGYQTRTFTVNLEAGETITLDNFVLFQNSPCNANGVVEISAIAIDDNTPPVEPVEPSTLVTLVEQRNQNGELDDTNYFVNVNGFVVVGYENCSSNPLTLNPLVSDNISIAAPTGTTVSLEVTDVVLEPFVECVERTDGEISESVPSLVGVDVRYTLVTTTRSVVPGPPKPPTPDPCEKECKTVCHKRVCEMSLYEYFRYKNAKRRGELPSDSFEERSFRRPGPRPRPDRNIISVVTQEIVVPYTFSGDQVLFNCLPPT